MARRLLGPVAIDPDDAVTLAYAAPVAEVRARTVVAAVSDAASAAANTTALDAAIASAGSGGQVFIPAGEFGHNGFATAAGVTIQGSGVGQTILTNTHASNPSVTLHGSPGGPYAPGVHLCDLTLSAADVNTGQVGVDCLLAQGFSVSRVEITGHDIGVQHRASWECLYQDVHVHDCTTGWLFPEPGAYTPSCPISVTASHAVDCATGVSIVDGVEALSWVGGDFPRCGTGLSIQGSNTRSISFSGCNFEGITGDDIVIGDGSTGPSNIVVAGARFFRAATGTRSVYFRRGDGVTFAGCRWTDYTDAIRQDASAGTLVAVGCSTASVGAFLDLNGVDHAIAPLLAAHPSGVTGLGHTGITLAAALKASEWTQLPMLYGTGKTTAADGDFAVTPLDGSSVWLYDTTDNTIRLAVRDWGAWHSLPAIGDLVTEGDVDSAIATRVPTTRTVTAGTGLTGGGDLSANRTLAVAYGTSAGTAAQGNDSRLSDTRTPTDASVTDAKVASNAAIALSKLATGRVSAARNGTATTTGVDVLTEAQYTAIGSKDSNTLYFTY